MIGRTYPPRVPSHRDFMIAKNSCVIAIKILRLDKTLRDHRNTGDAIYVLNHEISGFDTRGGSGRTGRTGRGHRQIGPARETRGAVCGTNSSTRGPGPGGDWGAGSP